MANRKERVMADGDVAESAANRQLAAQEIAELAQRILALAPVAGLYVGIKIEPAKANGGSHE